MTQKRIKGRSNFFPNLADFVLRASPYWQLLLLGQVKCLSNAPGGVSVLLPFTLFYIISLLWLFPWGPCCFNFLATNNSENMSDGQNLPLKVHICSKITQFSHEFNPIFIHFSKSRHSILQYGSREYCPFTALNSKENQKNACFHWKYNALSFKQGNQCSRGGRKCLAIEDIFMFCELSHLSYTISFWRYCWKVHAECGQI